MSLSLFKVEFNKIVIMGVKYNKWQKSEIPRKSGTILINLCEYVYFKAEIRNFFLWPLLVAAAAK